jgi:hypothetical protein
MSTQVRGPARSLGAWLPAALFVAALLIAGFTMLRGIDPFDEGLVLQAARRVAAGQLPYRDFLWSYGPAQPYLLGGSVKAFGVSLLGWRILRLVAVAATATIVFGLARRMAGRKLAVVVWLAAVCALAQPASANPFPMALAFGLGGFALVARPEVSLRRALLAGVLLGVAGAWRLDFAGYTAAAAACCLALMAAPWRQRLRLLLALGGAFALVSLAAYLPFVAAAGSGDVYDNVLGKSLRDKQYWTLPFPLSYHGRLRGWPPSDLFKDLKDVLGFYLPLLLVVAGAVAGVAGLLRVLADRRPPAVWAGLLVLAVGMLAYLLSRTDEFHTAPLVIVLALLLAAAVAWRGPRSALGVACGLLLALLTLYGVSNRLSALFLPPRLAPLELPVADGVRAPPGEARALARVVGEVRRLVPAGQPIYVAPRRSDLVRFNDPLLYVLTQRENPLNEDFGLQASAAAQRRIVAALERVRPRVVVRWTDPLSARPEPKLGGRSSGSRLLDSYMAHNYRVADSAGHYQLLVPR